MRNGCQTIAPANFDRSDDRKAHARHPFSVGHAAFVILSIQIADASLSLTATAEDRCLLSYGSVANDTKIPSRKVENRLAASPAKAKKLAAQIV